MMQIYKKLTAQSNSINRYDYLVIVILLAFIITASLVTHFNTIYLLLLLPLGFYTTRIRFPNLNTIKKTIHKNISLLFIPLIVFTIFNLQLLLTNNLSVYDLFDASFYAQISAYISNTGLESYFVDYTNISGRNPIPYHYGESYLTIIISKIFQINELIAQTAIAIPLLVSFGVVFLWKTTRYLRLNKYISSLIVLIIVIGPFDWIIYLSGIPYMDPDEVGVFTTSLYFMPKQAFAFAIISLIIYCYVIEEFKITTKVLALAIFLFISNISFFSVLLSITFIYMMQNKFKINIEIVLTFLSILSFYLFYKFNNLSNASINPTDFPSCLPLKQYILTGINIIVKSTYQIVLLFSPLFMIFLVWMKLKKKIALRKIVLQYKQILYALSIIYLTGLLSWALLWYSVASVSLFADGAYIIFRIALLTLILFSIASTFSSKRHAVIIVFLIAIAFPAVIKAYKHFVFYSNDNIPSLLIPEIEKEKPFIYLRHYKPVSSIEKNIQASSSLPQISHYTALHQGVFVELESIPKTTECIDNYRIQKMIDSSPFQIYKNSNSNLPDSLLINKFINDNNIDYLIADTGSIIMSETRYLKYLNIKKNPIYINEKNFLYVIN